MSRLYRVLVECTLSITHCLRLNLQLHTIDLVRTCRISSFCTVAWQLARFQLTRCIARSSAIAELLVLLNRKSSMLIYLSHLSKMLTNFQFFWEMSRNLQPQSIATSWLYQITLPDDRDRCEHLLSISCGCCHMTVSSVIYVVVFRLRVKSVTYLQSASHYWFRVSVCHQQVSPALLHRQLLKYYLCTVFIC